MSKRDLSKIAITDDNSPFSNDFIKKYTNFDNAKGFCNALGIYTLKDLVNLKWSPVLYVSINNFKHLTFLPTLCYNNHRCLYLNICF